MAYQNGRIVVADAQLNQAVRNALLISGEIKKDGRVRIQRNSMSESSESGSQSGSGYNSYFTLKDISEVDATGKKLHKVAVVDGFGRGHSVAKVNNISYTVGDYESGILLSTTYFILEFTASDKSLKIIETAGGLPDDSAEHSYYQVGCAIIDSNGNMKIAQDHYCGVAQMFWYDVCGD